MNINLPFYFTKRGRGIDWRLSENHINVTLRYEDNTEITTNKLTQMHLSNGNFIILNSPVSGYFIHNNDMIRVTNLVGFNNGNLLKMCPSCGEVKPITEFDHSGRYTPYLRDQSQSSVCRSSY